VATLVRHYDYQLLVDPATVPWTHLPLSVPDKKHPFWAKLTPRA